MKLTFKWLTAPFTNQTREVEAVQMWNVRWQSRNGEYTDDTQPELEAFPTEAQAQEFATALRNAFALIRYTSGTRVSVRRG